MMEVLVTKLPIARMPAENASRKLAGKSMDWELNQDMVIGES
jgi:hypothetical protein